ncbi:lamin tail domain-containing protein [Myxococcus stipitatus]|uniref:hypothetical protein n=1 Tax=Myxococcus stipitatus TaxID=83455 RepID=UPI00314537FF
MRGWGWWLGLLGLSACGVSSDEWAEEACAAVLPGDLVITEYLNDPEGTDTGREYVELHNPHAKPVALESLTLYVARSDGSQEKGFSFTEPRSVLAGDYLVLGDVRDGPLPAHVDLSYGDALGALGNASGKLGVRCGSRVIDEVPLSAPARSGLARALDGRLWPDSAGNDDLSRWCDVPWASGGSGTFHGSPGAANAPCAAEDGGSVGEGVATCVPLGATSPRSVKWPRVGELVITEVMVNPLGDDTLGEWVEVLATAPVDLNGLSIGSDTTGAKLQAPHCLSLPAGGFAVLARREEAVLNGGLPTPVAVLGVDLRNSGGVVQVRAGEVMVDAMAYGASEEGVATQVSPRAASASGNDAPAAWCRATEPYGPRGNRGTPGRVNLACDEGAAAPDGGTPGGGRDGGVDAGVPDGGARDGGGSDAGSMGPSCIDRGTGKARAVRTPGVGSLVLTELMADPAAVADGMGEWVEVLALREVDLNGVTLMNEGGASTTLEAALCLSMRAGSRGVLARNADASVNGGLPSVLASFQFNLANASGPRSLRLGVAGQLLDSVAWTQAATPGVSWQVDPASSDPWRNDVPGSFCLSPASARYGLGDRGTPGLENRACAP